MTYNVFGGTLNFAQSNPIQSTVDDNFPLTVRTSVRIIPVARV